MSPASPGDPVVRFEDIGPSEAEAILAHNTRNRPKKTGKIDQYARDMAAGKWGTNGESIKIAFDKTLLDGQNRLHAVIASDTTQRLLVVRNLPLAAQDTVDGGAKRSYGDVLAIRGIPRYNIVAAITRRVAFWEMGVRTRTNATIPLSTATLDGYLDSNPDIHLAAEATSSVRPRLGVSPAILGFCYLLFNRIDAEDCRFFFERFADGGELATDHPIAALRKTLIGQITSRSKLSEVVLMAYTIKSWNAYREGRTISHLRYQPGGARPEVFPEPK